MDAACVLTWWTPIPKQPPSESTRLRVGRLTKAHGLKGAIKIELYTDEPDRRFTPGAEFHLQVPESSPWFGRTLTLTELRWYNQHPVVFFDDVADRTAAESLIKAILLVDHDPTEVLDDENAWYDHQLVGLSVLRDGEAVGTVTHLEHLPAQDLLVVKTDAGEVMVPFVAAIVPLVDIAGGTITVTPPPGLFEPLPDDAVPSDESVAPEIAPVDEADPA